jgi:membrane protease YdiL (CAAX protease family)
MRTVFIFFSFIAYVFIAGAFLSPWVYDLIQLGKDSTFEIFGSKPFAYLAEQAFGKISNRCFMIVGAIGIYPMLKSLNCFNQKDLGYDLPRKEFIKESGKGLSFGFLSMFVLAALLIILNVRFIEDDATANKAISAIFKMLPGALIIALIEETFFRGIILNSMSRTLKPFLVIVLSSFIFATIHFLRNKTDGNFTDPQWYTGFSYLLTTLENFANYEFIGSWLTLFACGVFLSIVSLHYGNISRCIGIHCGWVLILSGIKKITDDTADEKTSLWWLIGNYDKVTGYLAFAIISIICFIYWLIFMKDKKTEQESK